MFKRALFLLAAPFFAGSVYGGTASHLQLTVVNGSHMPISPALIYSNSTGSSLADVGQPASAGFIKLCQTGNPSLRMTELSADRTVTILNQTSTPILPGESRTIDLMIAHNGNDNLYFEAMYGKTKDTCSVGQIDGSIVGAIMTGKLREYVGRDNALQTGQFADPELPSMNGSATGSICLNQMDAVSCLRSLASLTSGASTIRYFAPYLPSVVDFLETKYGSMDTNTLIISPAGAVQFRLRRL